MANDSAPTHAEYDAVPSIKRVRALLRRTPAGPAYRSLREKVYLRWSSAGRERLFDDFMSRNAWGSDESRSGPGSTIDDTAGIRGGLARFLAERNVRSLLDAPCGDWRWMSAMDLDLDLYIGADIVAALAAELQRTHGRAGREFRRLDVISDALPTVDAILCRDLLIHLPNALGVRALDNFRRSGATWLLSTTYSDVDENLDCHLGGFRQVNLTAPPFCLPEPIEYIREGLGGQLTSRGRALGVWHLPDLLPR